MSGLIISLDTMVVYKGRLLLIQTKRRGITLSSLCSIDTHVILNYSSFVQYSTYIRIEQLHHQRCYQKPCATPFLFLYARSLMSHSHTSQSSALLIAHFSHQFRLRVDSIHTSNSSAAIRAILYTHMRFYTRALTHSLNLCTIHYIYT
jgi:hypothetical protein